MAIRTNVIESVNPATEEVLARFDVMSDRDVDRALEGADRAFRAWRATPFRQRADRLRALSRLLRGNAERYARLMALEMGKPIFEARAEVEKCAWNADFYADHGEEFLRDLTIATNAKRSVVAFEPLGVVLAVMPWNFPFWQVIRFAVPALMAGNAAVLKHASNVPQSALALEELMREAEFPDGLFRTLLIQGSAAERIIEDDRVRAVTLTGSSATGRRIAEIAGRSLKKAVLELGGSDPFIVLADADLAAAGTNAARARNQNNGQSCIAAKRFIVVESVGSEFERRFADAVRALKVGDPIDPATNVGPLARADLREALERQVRESVRMGARVVVGGRRWGERGYFYEPTILADVTDAMPVFQEETFGPVAAIRVVRDADEAVRIANDTPYGLGASLWTRDAALGERLARSIEAGNVFVNGMVASDPRLPFGGVKQSGFGRGLSEFGIREFVNIQTIWIGPAAGAQQPPRAE